MMMWWRVSQIAFWSKIEKNRSQINQFKSYSVWCWRIRIFAFWSTHWFTHAFYDWNWISWHSVTYNLIIQWAHLHQPSFPNLANGLCICAFFITPIETHHNKCLFSFGRILQYFLIGFHTVLVLYIQCVVLNWKFFTMRPVTAAGALQCILGFSHKAGAPTLKWLSKSPKRPRLDLQVKNFVYSRFHVSKLFF